jgi:hypothetical protein
VEAHEVQVEDVQLKQLAEQALQTAGITEVSKKKDAAQDKQAVDVQVMQLAPKIVHGLHNAGVTVASKK